MEGDFIWPRVLQARANMTAACDRHDVLRASCLPVSVFIPPKPVGLGRGAQAKAGQGRHLSEAIAEFVPDPAFTEHRRLELLGSDTHFAAVQGTAPAGRAEGLANWGSDPKNSQTIGSPSLCLLSLGDARESESPAGARPGLQEDPTNSRACIGFDPSTNSARTLDKVQ